MLSINTNLSSLIAQNSMKTSSDLLNQAVERMTTGYKINHASDNAANYSISTNMTTKIGAYMVAEDNVLQGLDMVNTASENLSLIDDKLNRLRALAVQSINGTYGEQSLKAINAEANALVDEINRTYTTAEYNGIKTFKGTAKLEIPDGVGTTGNVGVQPAATYSMRATNYGDFLADPYTYTDEEVAAMTTMTQAIADSSLVSGGEYSISSVDELVALADYVNAGNDTTGMTFVLGADIDLSSIDNWTPIANAYNIFFRGTFDGNGHMISNLRINGSASYQGLFGYLRGGIVKNIGIFNTKIKGAEALGCLVGYSEIPISNCYATGTIIGTSQVGGLIGCSNGDVTNCSANVDVTAIDRTGGLIGFFSNATIFNSYATGKVNGGNRTGGLVGAVNRSSISNCYATGDVVATSNTAGGLVGNILTNSSPETHSITNCYAIGNVSGTYCVGGLVGSSESKITNSYATGNVIGSSHSIGGLVGNASYSIVNSYSTSVVSGNNFVGGLIGQLYKTSDIMNITNSLSYSTVSGSDADSTGGLIGGAVVTTNNTSFGTINVTDCQAMSSGMNTVGGSYMYASSTYTLLDTYDMSAILAGISLYTPEVTSVTLQVGANAPSSNQITFDMAFMLENLEELRQIGQNTTSDTITLCDKLINTVNEKQTLYGAVENRLMSALEGISTQRENLVSSRSTIRDADIAVVSSEYIRMQILQQASATLMATANQSPAIALQLI